MTFLDRVKNDPKFKRYCFRQSTRPMPKPKRFRVPIPKPLGPLSVLGEYTTGRMIRCTNKMYEIANGQRGAEQDPENWQHWITAETAILKKINGEFISMLNHPGDLPVETISQKPCEDWQFGMIGETGEVFPDDDETEAVAPEIENNDSASTLAVIALLEQQNALLRELAA